MKDQLSFPWDKQKSPKETSSLGANNWKVLTDVAWRIGTKGMESTFLKVLCNPHFSILFLSNPLFFSTNLNFLLYGRVVVH